jgi:hypothetical protein
MNDELDEVVPRLRTGGGGELAVLAAGWRRRVGLCRSRSGKRRDGSGRSDNSRYARSHVFLSFILRLTYRRPPGGVVASLTTKPNVRAPMSNIAIIRSHTRGALCRLMFGCKPTKRPNPKQS